MSTAHRSIKQRLERAKAPGLKAKVAQDWAKNWEDDQLQALEILERAIQERDWGGADFAATQLRAITDKRFFALPGVLEKISERGRGPIG